MAIRTLVMILALTTSASTGHAGVRRVWAVSDGDKIERDAKAHPLSARNAVWDGRVVRTFAARNEIVAFQLIVEADSRGVRELTVSLRELVAGRDRITYRPPAQDPTDYVERPIQIFAVHYMYVAMPSHASWVYVRGSPGAPADPTGWKPVQLVPENARRDRGGLPIAIAPNETQSIWIEVYVGRTREPGIYRGTIEVRADGERRTVPIELEVFGFTLPDQNSMNAMLYYTSDQAERYMGRNLDPAFHRLAHRHRVELVHAYNEHTMQAAWGRFSGADFTREHHYEGPGEGVGNVIAPRTFYGPGREFDDRPEAWARSDSWMTFLRKLPRAITFLYMPDEPAPTEYPHILKLAENIHSNPGPGKALPIFVTNTYVETIDPAIDIWCSGPKGFRLDRVASERARGREFWFYNGGRPAGGAITIDAPATDARATIWAAFKHDVRVYFYWHSVHWYHNHQKVVGDRNQNVWADSITYDNRKQPGRSIDDSGYIHGDGVLVYPGEERLHPEQDRGVPGPIATVQLANFRRGLQDHQYLTLARSLGLQPVVDEVLQAIVPRVFSDAGPTVSFPETGDPYEAARLKLARAIAKAR
jgi:Glycoside hydrolase 123, catalytic domain